MSSEASLNLDEVFQLEAPEMATRIAAAGDTLLQSGALNALADEHRARLIAQLRDLIELGNGSGKERVVLGEILGFLGDPRLSRPTDADYWVDVQSKDGVLTVGRHMVTNQEFREFVDGGAYQNRDLWSEEGWAWVQGEQGTWADRVASKDVSPYLISNQPVVGVTWFEANAYATHHGATLARFDERMRVVRGPEKRPYPWGSPFGEGNSNTQEEVLGRPCAVGLYMNDRTPEGVCDLAGNVAEWCLDGVGGEFWVHPGAWDQPSMAAWAKARMLETPATRTAGLGFRLVKA